MIQLPCDPSSAPRSNGHRLGAKPPVGGPPGDGPDWGAQDWGDLLPRLRLLAISRLTRMIWRGGSRGGLPGAVEAEDVVNDAIVKTIAGVRVWDRDTCTLFQHLAGVIVQEVSHAANSSENRLTLSDHGPLGGAAHWPPDIADEAPDPEHVMQWRLEQRRLLDHLSGSDPMLGKMAALMLVEDMHETRELCVALAVPPSEVANLRKRMKRAVCAYLQERQP